jgi:hypothetical protein
MRAYITASRPEEVAREVDRWTRRGCHSFVLRRVAGGQMRDQERLGAARYAAGIDADVQLEEVSSSPLDGEGVGSRAAAR